MQSVPVRPIRDLGLEGRVARRDPFGVDPAHLGPVPFGHRLDLDAPRHGLPAPTPRVDRPTLHATVRRDHREARDEIHDRADVVRHHGDNLADARSPSERRDPRHAVVVGELFDHHIGIRLDLAKAGQPVRTVLGQCLGPRVEDERSPADDTTVAATTAAVSPASIAPRATCWRSPRT